MSALKKPGNIRYGFRYQDLLGVKLLLTYLNDPGLYEWVKFECTQHEDVAIEGMDDIVALRKSDHRLEVTQVKFTYSPENPELSLSFEWLLAGPPKHRSLIQKWANPVLPLAAAGRLHSAQLLTDRIPDREVSACLRDDGYMDLSRLASARWIEVLQQFDSRANAERFFAQFRFSHSQEKLDVLERKLRNDIVPKYADELGWHSLLTAVARWSTEKDQPSSDGRITPGHVWQVLSPKAQAIPQNFRLPEGYQPPDSTFLDRFLRRIRRPKSITILRGSPGVGKSTFLSFVTANSRASKLQLIRHHYFLSTSDSTSDRSSPRVVLNSLLYQLRTRFPLVCKNIPNNIHKLSDHIETCAQHCKANNQPLVIIIDGLDHVWREQGSGNDLQGLFGNLLPLKENVSLVVGTQRIASQKMPYRLTKEAKNGDYVDLPLMSGAAVLSWLKYQRKKRRLRTPPGRHNRTAYIAGLRTAFLSIGGGHPLHLIYTFENLVTRKSVITESDTLLAAWGPIFVGKKEIVYVDIFSMFTDDSTTADLNKIEGIFKLDGDFPTSNPLSLDGELTWSNGPDRREFVVATGAIPAVQRVFLMDGWRWHIDVASNGVWLPTAEMFTGPVDIKCEKGRVGFWSGSTYVAEWKSWLSDWRWTKPRNGRSFSGGMTTIANSQLQKCQATIRMPLRRYIRAAILSRESEFDDTFKTIDMIATEN